MKDLFVVAMVKQATNERYVFLYDDESRGDVLRQFGKFAADPELSFSWHDAAIMATKIRQLKG